MSNSSPQPERTTFGHPSGLGYLFFAELWERFSFYGMRALLTLYLSTELFSDLANGKEIAYEIYAAYGSLVYFTPAIGGMIADRLIGHKNSIMLGAILMCIGHFVMAIENNIAFYAALGLLIIGNGFFKPNISSMVGGLYKEGDVRRDSGFTIFYMGINVGAFLAPLICGYLGEEWGWHYGFGAAGIGMLAGLIVFWRGTKINIYGDQGHQPVEYRDKKVLGQNVRSVVWLLAFLLVPLFGFLVNQNQTEVPGIGLGLLETLLWVLLSLVVLYVIFLMITKFSKVETHRIIVVMLLTFFITVFWAFFEQAGSSLTLFADEQVNLVGLNASQTNAINPGYIMLLAIPFSLMWRALSKRKKNPITPIKFSLGILQLGIGFLIFSYSMNYMDSIGKVPMMFLLAGYFLITTGELFASPIGLSKVTELSPGWLVSFMMGVWFLSSSFAHYIAGAIAKLTVTKASTEYVEESGFMVSFTEGVTGTDQNAMNKFSFEFSSAYSNLSDTSVAKYPTHAEYEKYVSSLGLMEPVNDTWKANSKTLSENVKKVEPYIDSLRSEKYQTSELLAEYKEYNKAFHEIYEVSDNKSAINLLAKKKELSDEEFEKEHGRTWRKLELKNPEAIKNAENFIAMQSKMREENPNWAENVISLKSGIRKNHSMVSSMLNLGTYTKVFALIGLISIFFAIVALVLSPIMKRWMHGIH